MTSRQDRAAALDHLMQTEGAAVRRNASGLNDEATAALDAFDDREGRRGAARAIKEQAIENLPDLIEQVE
ncbi:MAG: hypothetical protein V5A16_06230, partial [Haloplanus sp.]